MFLVGMPEMLKPTSLIMGAGLGLDVACLTDGRFSGGYVGVFPCSVFFFAVLEFHFARAPVPLWCAAQRGQSAPF